jgi:hypothetical protein
VRRFQFVPHFFISLSSSRPPSFCAHSTTAPSLSAEPLLSGQDPQEHAAESPRSSPSRSSSSSTLEHRTATSASSAVAAAALLDKLRQIPGPSDAEDLRRRPQVGSFGSIHFPLCNIVLGLVDIYFLSFLCFFFLS